MLSDAAIAGRITGAIVDRPLCEMCIAAVSRATAAEIGWCLERIRAHVPIEEVVTRCAECGAVAGTFSIRTLWRSDYRQPA